MIPNFMDFNGAVWVNGTVAASGSTPQVSAASSTTTRCKSPRSTSSSCACPGRKAPPAPSPGPRRPRRSHACAWANSDACFSRITHSFSTFPRITLKRLEHLARIHRGFTLELLPLFIQASWSYPRSPVISHQTSFATTSALTLAETQFVASASPAGKWRATRLKLHFARQLPASGRQWSVSPHSGKYLAPAIEDSVGAPGLRNA